MKLTPTMIGKIIILIETSHLPLTRIVERCGVTRQTLHTWLTNGAEHQDKLEREEIQKSDLSTKQKRELELYHKVHDAQTDREMGYLGEMYEIAQERQDAKVYQWLLQRQNKDYRDDVVEDGSIQIKENELVVVNISDKNGEGGVLLSEFINGVTPNAEESKGENTEVTDHSDE